MWPKKNRPSLPLSAILDRRDEGHSPTRLSCPRSPRPMAGLGQFERFTPSELSDRNGFVNETFAGMGVTDGSAPIPDLAALAPERAGSTISLASNSERVASLGQDRFWDAGISRM